MECNGEVSLVSSDADRKRALQWVQDEGDEGDLDLDEVLQKVEGGEM